MKFIAKKIITLLFTLLIVSFLVFLAFSVIPGDPALSKLGTEATPEKLETLREEMGLNKPLLVRYGSWILGVLQGDLGTSYSYQMKVTTMIFEKIPITITLTVMAFLFVMIISIPLGIYTAKHQGSAIDKCILIVNQVMMSIPPFFAGILITYLFGLVLKWFIPGDFISYTVNKKDFVLYLIFPAIGMAIPKCAMVVTLLRSSVIEQSKMDYARTAYSKGNTTNAVLYGHLLKNAFIPVITFLGMTFTDMIAGSVVIEQVFGIPGIGRILLTSISNRDYPVVQGIVLLLAFMVLIVNLLVDIIYQIIDPRMRQNR